LYHQVQIKIEVVPQKNILLNPQAIAFLDHYTSRSDLAIATSHDAMYNESRASTISESSWGSGKPYDQPIIYNIPDRLKGYLISHSSGIILPTTVEEMEKIIANESSYLTYHIMKIDMFKNLYVTGNPLISQKLSRNSSDLASKVGILCENLPGVCAQIFNCLRAHLVCFLVSPVTDAVLEPSSEFLCYKNSIEASHIFSLMVFMYSEYVIHPWVPPVLSSSDINQVIGLSMTAVLLKRLSSEYPLSQKIMTATERVKFLQLEFKHHRSYQL